MLDIARKIDVPPLNVARRILKLVYKAESSAVILALCKSERREGIENIPTRAIIEVEECIAHDDKTNPTLAYRSQQAAVEFENATVKFFESKGVAFETESEIKSRFIGEKKAYESSLGEFLPNKLVGKVLSFIPLTRPPTPDIHFLQPILINGIVVNWVDAKRMYGRYRNFISRRNQYQYELTTNCSKAYG